MCVCNNRLERKQMSLSHQVIPCIVWKIPEYLYGIKKGYVAGILSWLTGVSLLGGLALGMAGCLLQIQRQNVLVFHSYFISVYDVLWLHGRKQSIAEDQTLFKLCP